MPTRIGLLIVAAVLAGGVARADRLDGKLDEKMPAVVAGLKEKYKVVGVLPFKVQGGFDSPLCARMAERVSALLVIRNGDDESKALKLVKDVPRVAAAAGIGQWHSDAQERRRLFNPTYPMAWGTKTSHAEAFLTGEVTLSDDGKHTILKLQEFDSVDPTLRTVATLEMDTDRFVLRDLGYGFALSKDGRAALVGKRSLKEEEPIFVSETLEQNQGKARPHSPKDVGGIRLEMLADDKPVPEKTLNQPGPVHWRYDCPRPGAKVYFKLTNPTTKKLAFVLRLNGQSVLNRQEDDPENANKLVLEPGGHYVIKGTYEFPAPDELTKRNDDGLISGDADEKPAAKKPEVKPVIRPFEILVGSRAEKAKGQLGRRAGFLELDVFEEGQPPTEPQETVLLWTPRGLPANSDKLARATYSGYRGAVLKSSKLSTVVKEEKAADGALVKREMIVPSETVVTTKDKMKLVEFQHSRLAARLTVRVTPPAADE